jgi:N6-L-threonylcarbamoyladenine synthase
LKILAVETSCDETAAAVVADGRNVLSNVVASQTDLHKPYGGVVPEIASRNHLRLIDDVVRRALDEARAQFSEIEAVAATYGPGLATSLLIGLSAAKAMAQARGVPFVGINHLEAHLYSPFLSKNSGDERDFPMISLIVSGGHTILARVERIGRHKILGQTLDDAAGEAFDKVAKLLDLGYPGGPKIEKCARDGNPDAIPFPRSMKNDPSHDFSFSGIKTAALYYLRKHRPNINVADVCASFQSAVVDVLVSKTIRAAEQTGAKTVSASGGVSVNRHFRGRLRAECQRRGLKLRLAEPQFCTDNAAMIGALAFYKLAESREFRGDFSLDAAPSLGLE